MNHTLNKKFFVSILTGIIVISILSYAFILYNRKNLISPPSPAAIGIVNLSIIRNEGLAFKSFKELIESQYKLFHSQILEEETELRKSYEAIKQLESSSPKKTSELEKKRKEIDRKVLILEKTIREKKDKLNLSFTTIRNEIESTIQDIINDVAEKHNLNLVFNATIMDAPIVLYGGHELDITPYILEELDKRLPSVHADPVTVSK